MFRFNEMSTKKRASIFSLMYGAIVVVFLTFSSFAAGDATLTLSPSSGSYAINTNFTVTITQNSGTEPVNVADVYLNYDATKLQFVSVSNSTSAYDAGALNNRGGGNVQIVRYNGDGSPETGSKVVSRVTFRTLAGSGSTSITFGSSTALFSSIDSSDIWTGNATGGTYTLTTPTPTTPPPPPPPATNNNTTSNNNNSTTANTSTRTTSNTTDRNPDNNSPNTTARPSNNQSDPESTDTSESVTSDDVATGYLLAIKVLNGDEPVEGATVELDGRTAVSDATGVAGFVGIPEGEYEVKVVADGSEVLSKINVSSEGSALEVQEFEVQLQKTNLLVLLVIPVLIIGGLLAVKLIKRGTGNKNDADDYFVGTNSSPTVNNTPVDSTKPLIEKVAGVAVPVAGETIYPKASKDMTE